MNTPEITALVTAITALIGALITLITMINHLKNHQDIPTGKPVNTTAKPGIITPPANPEWPRGNGK